MAVTLGIQHSSEQNIPYQYNRIEVRTDSRYVVDNIKNAQFIWPKNKWCGKNGRPIENVDLWKNLIRAIQNVRKKVEFKWEKAHTKGAFKNVDNDAVDKMAKASAAGYLKPPLSVVKLRRKKSKEKTKIGSVDMKGQTMAISIINDSYLKHQKLSKYRYEVIDERSEYYRKVDIIYSDIHSMTSGHYYLIDVNDDTDNPRIVKLIAELNKDDYNLNLEQE